MSDRDDDRHEPDSEPHPDAPPSEEEVAASKRLRDALERSGSGLLAADTSPEVELALSLRAAWDPAAISVDESRAVLDATPSAEEQVLAVALRDSLARKHEPRAGDPEAAQLARALRAAFSPSELDLATHQAIIDVALAKMPARVVALGTARARVIRVAFGVVSGGLALAASIVFVVTTAPLHGNEAPLAQARTTQPLFSEPFKAGETSARIDRIASARASDFRDNRFTKWGVR